jgi:uncharacterized repeat protein (TIGR03803 family)
VNSCSWVRVLRAVPSVVLSATALLVSVQASQAQSWTLTTLHTFCSEDNCADGSLPLASLVQDSDGNIYGTTETGGAHNDGVVFALERRSRGWKYRVLHSFCFSCGGGVFPAAGLIVDVAGNLYGTTLGGGPHDCGIAFELVRPRWKLKTLDSFCHRHKDGDSPVTAFTYAGRSEGALYDGVSPLYGATGRGGANGRGTVYRLDPAGGEWRETVLYDFCAQSSCTDGADPSGDLLMDPAGNLFGNALLGGTGGAGLVYQITDTGKSRASAETVLYSFCSVANCDDGADPSGALAVDEQGNLYGTTQNTGNEGGALFRLANNGDSWEEEVVHTFCTHKCHDGYLPASGVTIDSTGTLFGVDELGGTGENGVGGGVAFQVTGGKVKPVYQFCSLANCADGRVPQATPIVGRNGELFGTTAQGGETSAAGTVFMLTR